MKLFISTVLSCLVLTLAACAQQDNQTVKPTQDVLGSADFSKCFTVVGSADYNFGTIDADQTVEHTFVFKNNCGILVSIEQARASCGCTAAILSEKDIAPGGEAKIHVKFTPPKGTRGNVTKTVSVYLKGESQPHTMLKFTANVKTDLDIQPSFIQLMGAVAGQPVRGTTTLRNTSEKDMDVTIPAPSMTLYVDTTVMTGGGTSIPEPLTAVKINPMTFVLKAGEAREVTVEATPQKKGQMNGTLRIQAGKSEAYVTVYGIVRPPAVVTPPPAVEKPVMKSDKKVQKKEK